MRYILSRASRPILARLAREQTLCAFDFDGTLAPITEHPERAAMRGRTRRLLTRVAEAYPCVILSGRSRDDAQSKLRGVPVAQVIGNHGAETKKITAKARRLVKEWNTALMFDIGSLPGVWVEDKGLSLAVHYRQALEKRETRSRIAEAARNLMQVSVIGGKQVVNLVITGTPDKGQALASERNRLRCKWALFVGDDENDEEAFALGGNIVAIRVGLSRRSHAPYYIRSQAEIDELLELLVSLRTGTTVRV